MKIYAYLLIDSDGVLQVRKGLPVQRAQQVAIRLVIDIDDSWFARPIPTVKLEVPNDHVLPMIEVRTEPIEEDEPRDLVAEAHDRIAHKNDDELPDHLA